MKLTIDLEKEDVMWFVTELEAKGCYEVAKAIEDAYTKEMAADIKRQIRNDFRKSWTKGYYFKHNNGNVTAIYTNTLTKQFHYGPLYVNGKLMGQPRALHNINEKAEMFKAKGFTEV